MASSDEFVQICQADVGDQRRVPGQAHERKHNMAASIALRRTKRGLLGTTLIVVALLTSITMGAGVASAVELCWKVLYG